MRAEKVMYSLLTGDAGVAALVANRVYPGKLPQNTVMPAISYEMVSAYDAVPVTANGNGTLVYSRVQVTALAKSYADCKAVLEAARKAVLFKSGLILGVRVMSITRAGIGPDQRDDDLNLYLQSVDYTVLHDET